VKIVRKLARKEKGVEYLSRTLENSASKAPQRGSGTPAFGIKNFLPKASLRRMDDKAFGIKILLKMLTISAENLSNPFYPSEVVAV